MSTPANDPAASVTTASRYISAAEAAIRTTPNVPPAAVSAMGKAQDALGEALARLAR